MYRLLLLAAIVLTSAGCHLPMPKFQPFAGAGSPRVPPPATDSYGKPDTYYNSTPSAGAQSATPAAATTQTTLADGGWRTPTHAIGSGVMTPSSTTPNSTTSSMGAISRDRLGPPPASQPAQPGSIYTAPNAQQATFIESPTTHNSTTSSTLMLNGMKVNDATRTAEPARFIPTGGAIEISQLPRPTAAAFTSPGVGSMPAATASPTSAAAAQPLSADGWRSKYVPLSGGVAAR